MKIRTVGELKNILGDLPDETEIISQVVAEDGTAWNMAIDAGRIPNSAPTMFCIILRHPHLMTLPDGGWVSDKEETVEPNVAAFRALSEATNNASQAAICIDAIRAMVKKDLDELEAKLTRPVANPNESSSGW